MEILKLHTNILVLQDFFKNSVQSLDTQAKDLQDELGMNPAQIDFRFDAPNLWSIVGNLASILENVEDVDQNSTLFPTSSHNSGR